MSDKKKTMRELLEEVKLNQLNERGTANLRVANDTSDNRSLGQRVTDFARGALDSVAGSSRVAPGDYEARADALRQVTQRQTRQSIDPERTAEVGKSGESMIDKERERADKALSTPEGKVGQVAGTAAQVATGVAGIARGGASLASRFRKKPEAPAAAAKPKTITNEPIEGSFKVVDDKALPKPPGTAVAPRPSTAPATPGKAVIPSTAASSRSGLKDVGGSSTAGTGYKPTGGVASSSTNLPRKGMTPLEKGATAAGIATGAAGVSGLVANRDTGSSTEAKPATNTAPPSSDKTSEKPKSFSQAFAAAREKAKAGGSASTGSFQWTDPKTGKTGTYQTNVKGERFVSAKKQTPTNRPAIPPRRPTNEETKMSSTMIEAFLKLHSNKNENLFNEAKKLSPKEKELAAMGHPKDKITHKDVLIGRGVLAKEESTGMERLKSKVGLGPKSSVDPSYKPDTKSKEDRAEMDKKVKEVQKEEVEFSETELAHIASILEMPVAPTPHDYSGSHNGVSKRDLSDETIVETKKKDPSELKQRGRKAGVKVGAYKMKGMDDTEAETAKAEPKNLVAQNPRTYSKDGKNVVDVEHPTQSGVKRTIPAKDYNSFRSSYLNAEKPQHKTKMHDDFTKRVFN
jgi:hypothetical protein